MRPWLRRLSQSLGREALLLAVVLVPLAVLGGVMGVITAQPDVSTEIDEFQFEYDQGQDNLTIRYPSSATSSPDIVTVRLLTDQSSSVDASRNPDSVTTQQGEPTQITANWTSTRVEATAYTETTLSDIRPGTTVRIQLVSDDGVVQRTVTYTTPT